MTFHDLPPDWPSRPVTDPSVCFDVLDLVVTERLRHRGGLAVLLCRPDGRLAQPIEIHGDPMTMTVERRRTAVTQLLQTIGALRSDTVQPGLPGTLTGIGGMVIALARRAPLSVRPEDRLLTAEVAAECERHGLRLFGSYLVTSWGAACISGEHADSSPVPWQSRGEGTVTRRSA